MEVSRPKSSCYCALGVLTPCFINCSVERGFCVVCPTLPAFFDYLCTILMFYFSKSGCLMLWVFAFLQTVLCCACLFLLQFLTGILTLIPYQLDFFQRSVCD